MTIACDRLPEAHSMFSRFRAAIVTLSYRVLST